MKVNVISRTLAFNLPRCIPRLTVGDDVVRRLYYVGEDDALATEVLAQQLRQSGAQLTEPAFKLRAILY